MDHAYMSEMRGLSDVIGGRVGKSRAGRRGHPLGGFAGPSGGEGARGLARLSQPFFAHVVKKMTVSQAAM
jgi:hypothetical protein